MDIESPFHRATAGVVHADGPYIDSSPGWWMWQKLNLGQRECRAGRMVPQVSGQLELLYGNYGIVQPWVHTAKARDGLHIHGLQDHNKNVNGKVHSVWGHDMYFRWELVMAISGQVWWLVLTVNWRCGLSNLVCAWTYVWIAWIYELHEHRIREI